VPVPGSRNGEASALTETTPAEPVAARTRLAPPRLEPQPPSATDATVPTSTLPNAAVSHSAGPHSAAPANGVPHGAVPTNIYRARRPAVAVFLILPAVAVGLLLLRGLAISAFGRPFVIGGVIASSLALASLPLLVAGIYGLITGAAHGAEHWGFRVWARPPLAYLIVGIFFVLAAGLAIR
jgi:hypothetical protein